MYYLLFFVNQGPFSIDKNQQNEYTELPTIAVIGLGLAGCMLQALAYSWQEVFLDVISSEYIYICNKAAAAAAAVKRRKKRRRAARRRRRTNGSGLEGLEELKAKEAKQGQHFSQFFIAQLGS